MSTKQNRDRHEDVISSEAFAFYDPPAYRDAWSNRARTSGDDVLRSSLDRTRRYPRLVSRRSLIAAGVAALGATAGIAVPLTTRGSFYPGTSVGGVDISEMSMESARALLQEQFAPFEELAVNYVFENQQWDAGLADLGFAIDYEATLNNAYNHGRDGVVDRYSGVLLSTDNQSFPVVFVLDNEQLTAFLGQIGPEIKGAVRDAQLYLSGDEIKILKNRDGRQLDIERAVQDTVAAVQSARRSTVSLTTVPVVSPITVADLEPVRVQTEILISDGVTVQYGNTRWNVPREMLIESLTFPDEGDPTAPWLDAGMIAAGLQGIADEMYAAPVNAVVGWDSGVYAVEDDIPGQEVDMEQLTAGLIAAAATADARLVELPMRELLADVRTDNLGELGITDFLAEGSSSFAGSSEARAENVRVSAGHVAHTLIAPGETCSFNSVLGPISLDNGFVEGKIIKGTWIESDIGGGACQASTTVFRAALFAGLEFGEWNHHTFRLAFYEADGSPPGLDAAIYQPNNEWEWELDLTFVNPTDSWMLLEMSAEGATAVASLYGSPTGYDVDVSVPYVSAPIPPGPPMEKVDDKLQKGQREKIQSAGDGFDVMMRRVVSREGEVIEDKEFWSKYQPQQETWAIGPGTKRKFPVDGESPPTETEEATEAVT
ncbi:MAG TPA: VanW family protein [Thermomicrobiales bacterium]|nr:VanW family protein [Thermomicrobiales bacterium]